MTKPKVSNFQSFYAFFVKVWTDFAEYNVLKINKEKFGCPVVLYEEIIAML